MSLTPSTAILATCPWIPSFRSDDLDEVRAYLADLDGRSARVAHGSQPMGCELHHAKGWHTKLGSTTSAVGQTARWLVDGPSLQLSVPVGSVFRVGRQRPVPTGPSSVVILPPAWEWTRVSPPGSVFAVQVQSGALRDELRGLRPEAGGHMPRQLVMWDIDLDHRARLFAAAAQATRPGADPQQLALAEARLVMEMAQLMPQGPIKRRPADMTEQRARDVEGWIEAHLGEPITLGQLCRVAGVGARCLQRTFEYRRGVSPMRFVADRRLAATHHALLKSRPDASVTHIALANGFDHFGRFSQLYREVIGELPSQTLARRRSAPRQATDAAV